jgi:hypothetical protein
MLTQLVGGFSAILYIYIYYTISLHVLNRPCLETWNRSPGAGVTPAKSPGRVKLGRIILQGAVPGFQIRAVQHIQRDSIYVRVEYIAESTYEMRQHMAHSSTFEKL